MRFVDIVREDLQTWGEMPSGGDVARKDRNVKVGLDGIWADPLTPSK